MIISQINREKARFNPVLAVDCNPSLTNSGLQNAHLDSVYYAVMQSDPLQVRAFHTILAALSFYTNPERCRSCTVLLDECFARWSEAGRVTGFPLGVFYGATLDGKPFRAIDRLYRRRHGWSKKLFPKLLALWPQDACIAAFEHRHLGCESAYALQCFCLAPDSEATRDEL